MLQTRINAIKVKFPLRKHRPKEVHELARKDTRAGFRQGDQMWKSLRLTLAFPVLQHAGSSGTTSHGQRRAKSDRR